MQLWMHINKKVIGRGRSHLRMENKYNRDDIFVVKMKGMTKLIWVV